MDCCISWAKPESCRSWRIQVICSITFETVVWSSSAVRTRSTCRHPAHPGRANNSLRAIGERGNSLLKMTVKALRNVSLNP
jgi:hypothetical protein